MYFEIAPKVCLGCNFSLFGISHGTVYTVFLKALIDLEFEDVKCLSVKNHSFFSFPFFFVFNAVELAVMSFP